MSLATSANGGTNLTCRPVHRMSADEGAKRTRQGRAFWSVHDRSEKSVKPQLWFLRCRAHPHVRARRVFDNRELASARFARRNAARIKLPYPFVPDRPPRP
jgi:hypothetical protein